MPIELLIAITVIILILVVATNFTDQDKDSLQKIWTARLHEMAGKTLESPGKQAIGHIMIVMVIASGIGAATAQVSQLEVTKEPEWLRFSTTAILPILLSAIACIGWHRWARETIETGVLTSWILHTFYNPGEDHIELSLPTPETYLVIAATASAGASIALRQEDVQTVTAISAVVGGLTSALIASAGPRVRGIVGKKKLRWQTQRQFTQLLENREVQGKRILKKQRYKCRDCHSEIKQGEARFSIVDREELPTGPLTNKHIKAVCKNCAVGQPSFDPRRHN